MTYRRMRATSQKRRSGSRGGVYDMRGFTPIKAETPPHALPVGSEGSVVCPECRTTVKVLGDGQTPTSHAPGGFSQNIEKGRYRCSGSGAAQYQVNPVENLKRDKPVYSKIEAVKNAGLVPRKLVAQRYGVQPSTVASWERKGTFPERAGYYKPDDAPEEVLYHAGMVVTAMKTYHPNYAA